jgi:hypothetical protein
MGTDNPYTRTLEIPAELLEPEPTPEELQALEWAHQMGKASRAWLQRVADEHGVPVPPAKVYVMDRWGRILR